MSKFDSNAEYLDKYSALIALECARKPQIKRYPTKLTWMDARRCSFTLPETIDTVSLYEGGVIKIKLLHDGRPQETVLAEVLQINQNNYFTVKLNAVPDTNWRSAIVEIKGFNSYDVFSRMTNALNRFCDTAANACSELVHKNIMQEADTSQSVISELPQTIMTIPNDHVASNLNEHQSKAILKVLSQPVSLVQGPPGTGKTVISTAIVYHLRKLTGRPVLVCAPSNTAVDQLAVRLSKTGLNVIRLQSVTREKMHTPMPSITLVNRIIKQSKDAKLVQLLKMRSQKGIRLKTKDWKYLSLRLPFISKSILSKADVVCCTCSAAGDRRLQELRFSSVLIDEAGQSVEPDSLIPITLGAQQVVLVGDHKQLAPVVLNKKAILGGLNRSLFERLIELGHVPVLLNEQYRMHPKIAEFPSLEFYGGLVKNGITEQDREPADNNSPFPWPQKSSPWMFWHVDGPEKSLGSSYANRSEIECCYKVITQLITCCGVAPKNIGVVTPYSGQQTIFKTTEDPRMCKYLDEIEANSVDGFQGREKDYIIFSCVRSNSGNKIGFVDDQRRLNVAVTRAKYGLIIVGNASMLEKADPVWKSLCLYARSNKCLVEGSLNDWKLKE